MKRESRAPVIFAIALLLLPVLYVASYFALVHHSVKTITLEISSSGGTPGSPPPQDWHMARHYRFEADGWASQFYWPLEQVDRLLRPHVWAEPHNSVSGVNTFLAR
ncbi:hypothetical protein [Anatilimnocola floriformis]|uniref:hypothetical protein n=1 Tax=Anatilimnocola floriformis TaxID=2948575 RepID=UPI0020C5A6BC|nr:hypothetical protein [Anatilimnocola floriformis]